MHNNHYAFQWTCANGFTSIVKALLYHKSSNPQANNAYNFRVAAQNNHYDTLDLLLKDSRIDPTALLIDALTLAID